MFGFANNNWIRSVQRLTYEVPVSENSAAIYRFMNQKKLETNISEYING
jgi:hypothetical protein